MQAISLWDSFTLLQINLLLIASIQLLYTIKSASVQAFQDTE